jgi:pimeloyl-ACP methyl ester carboxylesterase
VVSHSNASESGFLPKRSVFAATLRLDVAQGDFGTEQDENSLGGCQLELSDPLRVDQVVVGDHSHALAKDLSASLAYILRDERRTYLNNFINPRAASGESRLYTLEPYQPRKIPVVLVHGLLSDPFTWVEMVNELRAHPGFVDHFQIWVFEYPTGEQFLRSAAELRKQFALARQTFDPSDNDPQICNTVLVGHSMGGLISKLQVTSSGDQVWRSVANRPLDQIVMPENLRQELAEIFYFGPSPCVSRVVFMATPHRGSSFATRWIGRVGSSFVSMPEDQRQQHRELIDRNPGVFSDEVSRRIPTSIDMLEPKSLLLNAIKTLPVSERVRLHSVIGNRCWRLGHGRSDGVVPVESAREPRAVTERLIRAKHGQVNEHPESIQELLLILNEHLQTSCTTDRH